MQAAARHDVGLAAKDDRGALLHVHQLKQAKLALFVIEEQINVGIVCRFAACGRAEQIQMIDAKLFQLGFVLLKSVQGIVAVHAWIIAQTGAGFHIRGRRLTPGVEGTKIEHKRRS